MRHTHAFTLMATLLAAGGLFAPVADSAIVTDGTMGAAQSLQGPDFRIDQALGTLRGGNLFHSFRTFDILTGETARFTAAAPIDHVISRVTGGATTTIDGLLRSEIPGAEFWFLNPAGVFFGPNAALDIPASVHVSTADELRLADGGLFSAANPAASSLTIAPPAAFGFLGGRSAAIEMDGAALELTPGTGFDLIAGDIALGSASLWAERGRIRLAAMGDQAAQIPVSGGGAPQAQGTLTLNRSELDVSGDGGGDLEIRAGRLEMAATDIYNANQGASAPSGGSRIDAGSFWAEFSSIQNNAFGDGASGPLQIAVQGDLWADYGSQLQSATIGAGRAGDVSVQAGRLALTYASNIVSFSFGVGDAGDVEVAAGELTVDGQGMAFYETGITSYTSSSGAPGDVSVRVTGDARLIDAGMVGNTTLGRDAGDVFLSAERLTIDGAGAEMVTGVFSRSKSNTGAAGSVRVEVTDQLSILNGGIVANSAFYDGDAGSLVVETGRLLIDGQGAAWETGISSQANGGLGNGGTVEVRASEGITLAAGGTISASTFSEGAGGTIQVETPVLTIDGTGANTATGITSQAYLGSSGPAGSVEVYAAQGVELIAGGTISASTFADGAGGSIRVESPVLTIDGRGSDAITGITSQALFGSGPAGDLEVVVGGRLKLVDGGRISSSTLTKGAAGTVWVSAGEVEIDRGALPGITGLFSFSSDPEQGGDAGTVELHSSGDIRLLRGGQIGSYTFGPGAGGTVIVTGRNLTIDGSGVDFYTGISSQAQLGSGGDAGDVWVDMTDRVELLGGGAIASSTDGEGDAGTVEIWSGDMRIDGSAAPDFFTGVSSRAGAGSGGEAGEVIIRLDGELDIFSGGAISTSTYSVGQAGSVFIDAASLHLDGGDLGNPTYIYSQAEPGSSGRGGSVELHISGDLVVERGAQISSGTFSSGNSGSVIIEAGRLRVIGSAGPGGTLITSQNAAGASGSGGEVYIRARSVEVVDGAQISSATFTVGDAGTVLIEAGSILVSGEGSAIVSLSTDEGGDPIQGGVGEVILKAEEIRIEQDAAVSIAAHGHSRPDAPQGQAILIVADRLILDQGGVITAKSNGDAPAADIFIQAGEQVLLLDKSEITTLAVQADGGEIHIQGGALLLSDSLITTSAEGMQGDGGDIALKLAGLAMDSGFIQANTAAAGASGGDIWIDTPSLVIAGGQTLATGGDKRLTFKPDSGLNVIQAAAPDGVSGEIKISTPQLDLENGATAIEARIAAPVELRRDPCQVEAGAIPSSLATGGRGGLPWDAGSALTIPNEPDLIGSGAGAASGSPAYRLGCERATALNR